MEIQKNTLVAAQMTCWGGPNGLWLVDSADVIGLVIDQVRHYEKNCWRIKVLYPAKSEKRNEALPQTIDLTWKELIPLAQIPEEKVNNPCDQILEKYLPAVLVSISLANNRLARHVDSLENRIVELEKYLAREQSEV